jgi:hypothetical protein
MYSVSSPEAPLIEGFAAPAPPLSATPGDMLITDVMFRPIAVFEYSELSNTAPVAVLARSMARFKSRLLDAD